MGFTLSSIDMCPSVVFLSLAVPGAALLYLAFLIRRYLRLRHIPGPFIAGLTDWYSTAQVWWNDAYPHDILGDLHDKYGPVVRWGPNRVAFASAEAIPTIYSTSNPWIKAESYMPMTVVSRGGEVSTLLTVRDEKRVSAIKRNMIGGFSQASFLRQEDQLDSILVQLLDLLKQGDDQVVEISKLLKYWSFDTINRVAFSDDLGFMKAGADIGNTFDGVQQRFEHWRIWFALPTLERLIFKNPIARRVEPQKSILADLAVKRIQQRQREEKTDRDRDLLGKFLAAHDADPESIALRDVLGLTISTIHAGSDTTASACSLILVNLLRNPEKLRKLEAELLAADLPVPAPFEMVAQLPYLEAVVRESMRVTNVSGNSRERIVPDGGATVCGVWLPGRTDVSITERQTSYDPSIWGSDSQLFRPERWTEATPEHRRRMDKYHMGFMQGRRMCVGQHLAKIEMKKMISSLLTLFAISLAEEPKVGYHMNTRAITLKVRLSRRK